MSALEPEKIKNYNSPESWLWQRVGRPALQATLTKQVLADSSFSPSRFRDDFLDSVGPTSDIIRGQVQYENIHYPEPELDRLRVFSKLSPAELNAMAESNFFPDAISFLLDKNQGLPETITKLRHPAITSEIIHFLKDVNLAISQKPIVLDSIFKFVRENAGATQYTIAADQAEALYFLSYLSSNLRFACSDFLINNFQLGFLIGLKGKFGDDGDSLIDKLSEYLKLKVVANSHWSILAKLGYLSESELQQLAQDRLSYHSLEADLITDSQLSSNCKAVTQTFLDFLREFMNKIRAIDQQYGAASFQSTDIGHGFNPDVGDLLHTMLDDRQILSKPINPAKAVILEDNPTQMNAWVNGIQRFSQYVSNQEDRHSSPESVAFKSDVSLYLLDIQNESNDVAGIEVAEKLLIQAANAHKAFHEATQSLAPKIRIVVWSLSTKSVELAKSRLQLSLEEAKKIYPHIDVLDFYSNSTINIAALVKFDHLNFLHSL
jgi:hypothetical protein